MLHRHDVLDRTAWLFTRDQESIYIQVEQREAGWRLTLRGPGDAWRTQEFSSSEALAAFHIFFEQDLISAGFRLHAVTERRGGGDRRQVPRTGSTERRR